MAYKTTEDCVSCGSCETECPNDAIGEGELIYVIDPDKCSECVGTHEASQYSGVCPVSAPIPDPNHKESRKQLL